MSPPDRGAKRACALAVALVLVAAAGAVGLGATMWVLLAAPVALLLLVRRR